jgi:hypothetical protein
MNTQMQFKATPGSNQLARITAFERKKLAVWVGLATLVFSLTLPSAFAQGIIKTLDFPGSTFTVPEDINNSGEIVGVYNDVNDLNQGLVYRERHSSARASRIFLSPAGFIS